MVGFPSPGSVYFDYGRSLSQALLRVSGLSAHFGHRDLSSACDSGSFQLTGWRCRLHSGRMEDYRYRSKLWMERKPGCR